MYSGLFGGFLFVGLVLARIHTLVVPWARQGKTGQEGERTGERTGAGRGGAGNPVHILLLTPYEVHTVHVDILL